MPTYPTKFVMTAAFDEGVGEADGRDFVGLGVGGDPRAARINTVVWGDLHDRGKDLGPLQRVAASEEGIALASSPDPTKSRPFRSYWTNSASPTPSSNAAVMRIGRC